MTDQPKVNFDQSGIGWISHGFEELVKEISDGEAEPFDVLIVGSGYGGAVAAMTFAGRTVGTGRLRVGVLERGNEYLPGAFPASSSELPGHIRIASNKEGLFDIRPGPEVSTVLANGLGGGSLINAGVMEIPKHEVFDERWPEALQKSGALDFDVAKVLLGAGTKSNGQLKDNTVEGQKLPKFEAIKALAKGTNTFRPAAITVALEDGKTTSGNVGLTKCNLCGDCATGCNFNAKESLDTNLLVTAHLNGAKIYTGATVLNIERDGRDWNVNAVYTSGKLRRRHGLPVKIRTRNLILAAGALGSTEILMRSRSESLKFSNLLGHRCSTNGDMLIAHYNTSAVVNTVANEATKPSARRVGPTITGVIDRREGTEGFVIEDMSVPAGLRRVFQEIFATANTLHSLSEWDGTRHAHELPTEDIYTVTDEQVNHSALFAVIGHDTAGGRIEVGHPTDHHSDGTGHIRMPGIAQQKLFEGQVKLMTSLTKPKNKSSTPGKLIPNPAWKMLPDSMDFLMGDQRGGLVTVHPLGGCVMADCATEGVVDPCGRVFVSPTTDNCSAQSMPKYGKHNAVYDGLTVLDGSIIPTALGTNPALTITAVAMRACNELLKAWKYDRFPIAENPALSGDSHERDRLRSKTELDKAPKLTKTQVRITERLAGKLRLKRTGRGAATYAVDLTLRFKPRPLTDLMYPSDRVPAMHLDQHRSGALTDSRIRVFAEEKWDELNTGNFSPNDLERELDKEALFSAPLTGTLTMFRRKPTFWFTRVLRSGWAYLRNRGLRDIWQAKTGFWKKLPDGRDDSGTFLLDSLISLWKRAKNLVKLASRSGEIRLEEYDLTIMKPDTSTGIVNLADGSIIKGEKHFTYARRCNPWRQLTEVEITKFPGLVHPFSRGLRSLARPLARRLRRWKWSRPFGTAWWHMVKRPQLKLDMDFLANIRIPMYEITDQENGVHALGEFGSYAAWFVRMLIGIHVWTFRLPDEPKRFKRGNRLPGTMPRIPAPEAHELVIGEERPHFEENAEPVEVRVRLTRYARPESKLEPIVMIHGYSASGTTYTHPSIKPNMARYFYKLGRDVWVVDLRTSCGMPTAKRGWSFEQVACSDIPAALCYINQQTNKKVDVVAHCMGAAMFSMAVLEDGGSNVGANYQYERDKLHRIIHKAVLSQVGPMIVFSPANRVRALVSRFMTEFLPDSYSFNPGPEAELFDDLIDRILYSVPYPEREFDIENPTWITKRTPWVRTRHRMDALYGRAFNLDRVGSGVLEHIDDLFGPLSIKTVSQTIHFASLGLITNVSGRNTFVSRENIKKYWNFPTLGIHGKDNGLSHISTQAAIEKALRGAGVDFKSKHFDDAGHQDCLIGTSKVDVMEAIKAFLDEEPSLFGQNSLEPKSAVAPTRSFAPSTMDKDQSLPWIGPLATQHYSDSTDPTKNQRITVRLGSTPERLRPLGVALLPVRIGSDGKVVPPDNQRSIAQAMWFYRSGEFERENWDAFLLPQPLVNEPVSQILTLVIYPDSADLKDDRTERWTHEYFRQTDKGSINRVDPVNWSDDTATLDPNYWQTIAKRMYERLNDQGSALRNGNDLLNAVITVRPPEPDGMRRDLRFALGSCQYQTSVFDAIPANRSYELLANQLASDNANDKPEFIVLTGDQIYVDATAGLLDPSIKDDNRYDKPYARWLQNKHVRKVLCQLPSFMMLDDHEIENDWEPVDDSDEDAVKNNQLKRQRGREAYLNYQFGALSDDFFKKQPQVNGGPGSPPNRQDKVKLSYTFRFAGHPFFVLDTRTEREHRNAAKLETATMILTEDMKRLKEWLIDYRNMGPKFVVSPAMILPRHKSAVRWKQQVSALASDGWDGYPATMHELLAYIQKHKIGQVVFLSGDEHMPVIANIDIKGPDGHTVRATSVHTSPTYAPFVFANSNKADFCTKPFDFRHENLRYHCTVVPRFPSCKDGFTLLNARQDEKHHWHLDIEFNGDRNSIDLGFAGQVTPGNIGQTPAKLVKARYPGDKPEPPGRPEPSEPDSPPE